MNKSELARRYNCDPRTIDRYLKISSGELIPHESSRVYTSVLDDYKEIIIDKVEALEKLTNRLNVYNKEFESFEELDKIINSFMNEINNETSQATNKIPLVILKKEKSILNHCHH